MIVGYLEGFCGYRLSVWEVLGKKNRFRLVGSRGGGVGVWVMAGVIVYFVRSRVGKVRVVVFERGSAEDFVNVIKGIYINSRVVFAGI